MRNPHYNPKKSHHTPTGFRNNYHPTGLGQSFLKWQKQRIARRLAGMFTKEVMPEVMDWNPEPVPISINAVRFTWIGHSTVLVNLHGKTYLTDPVFAERASPFSWAGPKRFVRPAVKIEQLPHIDVVLLSHNHYDHLDEAAVKALCKQPGGSPLFMVPLGIKSWMEKKGIRNVVELDWWHSHSLPNVEIIFVPAQHWSSRGLTDRYRSLWGGWVVKAALPHTDYSFFFAGDTGYSKDYQDIGEKFGGFDMALLPIGAYDPRWFMRAQHVEPEEAVKIHKDIRAKQSLAIHWGTFKLTDEPLMEPPQKLREALQDAGMQEHEFVVLQHGQALQNKIG